MRYQWQVWNERLFQETVVPATKQYLRARLGKTEEEDLEIDEEYPIVKTLLGVTMEEGGLRLLHVSLKLVMALLNDMVGVHRHKKQLHYVGTNDVSVVNHWVRRLGLEELDVQAVSGYALNHELVEWMETPFSGVQVKYRSLRTKLLVIYRLFFLILDGEYYIIMEKLS